MIKRTGASTLNTLAKRMCLLTVRFAPLIRRAFPDNTALHLAIDAANAACAALSIELEKVIEYGD